MATLFAELFAHLDQPFDDIEVEAVEVPDYRTGGTKVLFYPSITAIENRLDNTVGPESWSMHFIDGPTTCTCTITLKLIAESGEGYEFSRAGGFHYSESNNAGWNVHSIAKRRAASCLGVGRYLNSEGMPEFIGNIAVAQDIHQNVPVRQIRDKGGDSQQGNNNGGGNGNGNGGYQRPPQNQQAPPQQQNNGGGNGGYQRPPQQQNNGGGYQRPPQNQQNNGGGNGGYQNNSNGGNGNGGGYQRPPQQQNQQAPPQQNNGGYQGGNNGGGNNNGPPRSGKALFAWSKSVEEQTGSGILKYLNGWAKLQGFNSRMTDWDQNQVAYAYEEGCRKLAAEAQGASAEHN